METGDINFTTKLDNESTYGVDYDSLLDLITLSGEGTWNGEEQTNFAIQFDACDLEGVIGTLQKLQRLRED